MDLNLVLRHHQPAAVVEGTFYIPSKRRVAGAPVLVTATGNRMPMRPLARWSELSESHFAHRKAELAEHVRRDLERRVSQLLEGNVQRVCLLFTAVARAEAGLHVDDCQLKNVDACQLPLEEAVDRLMLVAPRPDIPSPALGLRGRLWRLRACKKGNNDLQGTLHLHVGDRAFVLQGDFLLAFDLLAKWNERLQSLLNEKADELASTLDHEECDEVVEAREAIRSNGAYGRGDLLFVAGPPPCVARILPPLGNLPFGKVAVGVPIMTPLRASPLTIFRRDGQKDLWKQCSPGRHLCTGPRMPQLNPDPSPVEILGYLRACAIRFAQNNGRFSEFD